MRLSIAPRQAAVQTRLASPFRAAVTSPVAKPLCKPSLHLRPKRRNRLRRVDADDPKGIDEYKAYHANSWPEESACCVMACVQCGAEGGHTWARASDDLQLKGVVALRRGPLGTFRQVLEALKAVGIVKMKIFLKGTRMFM